MGRGSTRIYSPSVTKGRLGELLVINVYKLSEKHILSPIDQRIWTRHLIIKGKGKRPDFRVIDTTLGDGEQKIKHAIDAKFHAMSEGRFFINKAQKEKYDATISELNLSILEFAVISAVNPVMIYLINFDTLTPTKTCGSYFFELRDSHQFYLPISKEIYDISVSELKNEGYDESLVPTYPVE
jgi:hypothetical protein